MEVASSGEGVASCGAADGWSLASTGGSLSPTGKLVSSGSPPSLFSSGAGAACDASLSQARRCSAIEIAGRLGEALPAVVAILVSRSGKSADVLECVDELLDAVSIACPQARTAAPADKSALLTSDLRSAYCRPDRSCSSRSRRSVAPSRHAVFHHFLRPSSARAGPARRCVGPLREGPSLPR
jgi:hypothetical protein